MRAPKSLALAVATALAAGGAVAVSIADPAQAATQTFQLYSQVSASVQPVPDNQGTQDITLTVTPSTAVAGDPIEVKVSSSTLNLRNGPASPGTADKTELVAVVGLGGTDYVLRGSRTGQNVATNDGTRERTPTLFKAGWVISSTPGNSSSTSDDGGLDTVTPGPRIGTGDNVAGSTGLGTAVRGAESTIVPLVAPATDGTYPLTLKAIILNADQGTATSTPALTNTFDSVFNTQNCTVCVPGGTNDGPKNSFNNNVASSYLTYSSAVNLLVAGAPSATVATSSAQPNGAQVIGRDGYSRAVTLTGGTFFADQASGSATVELCNTSGASCDDDVITNTLTTDSAGALSGGFSLGAGATLTTGNRAVKITGLYSSPVLVPVLVLGTPGITVTPSSAQTGATVSVSGSNFNVGNNTGIIFGSALTTPPYTATADPSVGFTTDATGSFSGVSFTVNAATTQTIAAQQSPTPPGPPSLAKASAVTPFTIDDTDPSATGAVAPATGFAPLSSTLTISGASDNVSPSNQLVAKVDWDDGSAVQTLAAGDVSEAHSYTAAGTYDPTFTLTDAAGNESAPIATNTVTVTADTTAPTATGATVAPAAGWPGLVSTLTIDGVADNNNSAGQVVAKVTWGDGSAEQTLAAGDFTEAHTYAAAGSYVVTYTLTDTVGNTSTAQEVVDSGVDVTVAAPSGTFTRTPTVIWETQTARLVPSGVGSDVASIQIQWGDGTVTNNASKTAATPHKYVTPATRTIKVKLTRVGTGQTVLKTVGTVLVRNDATAPGASVTTPSRAKRGASWSTVRGKVSDVGVGPASVTVYLVDKRKSDGKWYYFTGSSWQKATSKTKALSRAKRITDSTVSTGTWSITAKRALVGTLYVYYSARDKVGNKSAVRYRSQTITS